MVVGSFRFAGLLGVWLVVEEEGHVELFGEGGSAEEKWLIRLVTAVYVHEQVWVAAIAHC